MMKQGDDTNNAGRSEDDEKLVDRTLMRIGYTGFVIVEEVVACG